jgi:hypothetical protein
MTDQKNKKIVFVAAYPDEKGNTPYYFEDLEARDDLVLLHPHYDLACPAGIKSLEDIKRIKGKDKPEFDTLVFNRILEVDFWLISVSDLFVYDIDSNPGTHLLAAAIQNNIPIVGVSETLRSAPLYFSGKIDCVVRPKTFMEKVIGLTGFYFFQ